MNFALLITTSNWIVFAAAQSSGCGDQHTSCSTWAERGQCQSNPDFMLSTCPISCQNCPGKDTYQISLNAQCVGWSRRGECNRNPSYMQVTCPKSCGRCPTDSEDSFFDSISLLRKKDRLQCGSFNHTVGLSPNGVASFPVGPVASIDTGGRFKRADPTVAGGAPGQRDFFNAGGVASISSGSSSGGGSIFGGSGGGLFSRGSSGGGFFGGSRGSPPSFNFGGSSLFGGSQGRPSFGGTPFFNNFGSRPSFGNFGSRPSFGGFGSRPSSGSFGGRPSSGSFGGRPSSGSFGGMPSSGSFGGRPSFGSFGGRPSISSFPSGGFGSALPQQPFQVPRQDFQQPFNRPPFPPPQQPTFQTARPQFRPAAQTSRPAITYQRPTSPSFRPASVTFRPAAPAFRPASPAFRPAAPTFSQPAPAFGSVTNSQPSSPSQPSAPAFSLPPGVIRDNPVPSVTSNEVSLDDFFCGASLISDQHLLTAAHCVTNEHKTPREVTFREVSYNTGDDHIFSVSYEIESVIIHPEYSKDSFVRYHDLAILKTKRQVQFGPVTWPYCLPSANASVVFKTLTVSGWGKVNSSYTSENLQQAEVPAVPNNVCNEDYKRAELEEHLKLRYPQGLTDNLICAGQLGKDACEGDSGGPLTYHDEEGRETLVGVVSTGLPCGDNPLLPGIYASVARYIGWISSVIYE